MTKKQLAELAALEREVGVIMNKVHAMRVQQQRLRQALQTTGRGETEEADLAYDASVALMTAENALEEAQGAIEEARK